MNWSEWLKSKWTVAALVAGVVASLVLNVIALGRSPDVERSDVDVLAAEIDRVEASTGVLVAQSNALRQGAGDLLPRVDAALGSVIDSLASFATSTLSFTVDVDETIPVQAALPVDETVVVDLETTLPINETFETTVRVQTPLGFDIPLDVEIPVQVDVPVDLELPIRVMDTFQVDTRLPLQLSVPIVIDVSETDLATLTAGLEQFLRDLQARLADLEL